jgi:hypothetical protein
VERSTSLFNVNKQLSSKGKGEIITDPHLLQSIDQWRKPEQRGGNIYKGKEVLPGTGIRGPGC